MPHFSPTGHDMVLCQFCGRDCDSGVESFVWVHGRGNKCERCVAANVDEFNPAPGVVVAEGEVENEIIKEEVDLKKYNGKITIFNPKTGNHRTFKISTVKNGNLKGKRVLSLLNSGDSDYLGFAFVNEDGSIYVWKAHRGTVYETFGKMLTNSKEWIEKHGLQYKFSVKCRVCNKDLTDPISIDLGIGPVCRKENKPKPPISLYEHCRQESGGLTGVALDRYVNRYYGHN